MMSIKTFEATSDSSVTCDIEPATGTHYSKVSDASDSTYVYSSSGYKTDQYGKSSNDIPVGSTINSVTLKGLVNTTESMEAYVYLMLFIGAGYYLSDAIRNTSGLEGREVSWTTNPATGLAFTVDDITSLTFGCFCSIFDAGWGDVAQVAKLWLEVDYTPPAAASTTCGWVFM